MGGGALPAAAADTSRKQSMACDVTPAGLRGVRVSWGPKGQGTRNSSRRAGRLKATGASPDRPVEDGTRAWSSSSSPAPCVGDGETHCTVGPRESRPVSARSLMFPLRLFPKHLRPLGSRWWALGCEQKQHSSRE